MFRDYLTRLSKAVYMRERRLRIRQYHAKVRAAYLAIPYFDLGPSRVMLKSRTYALSSYKRKTRRVAVFTLINQLRGALRCVNDPEHCLFTRLIRARSSGTLDEHDLHMICWACNVLMTKETRPYVASTLKRVQCKLQMVLG